jgi:hypothetical protein
MSALGRLLSVSPTGSVDPQRDWRASSRLRIPAEMNTQIGEMNVVVTRVTRAL